MPVSMSTSASVNCTPLVPVDDRPSIQSPSTEIGSVPISLHASFHAMPFDGSLFTWMRPSLATSVAASTPSAGATFSQSASSALNAVTRIAGITLAVVVLPPEPPLNGYIVSPISGFTALTGRPSVSAVTMRDRRPRAGAEILRAALHHDRAVGVDVAVRLRAAPAAAPLVRGAAEAGLDRARRRIAGRVALVPAERFRAAREVVAPHRVRRVRPADS